MTAAWLEGLNQQQREAVLHGEEPMLIVAGAGTGKTRTLACRVAHLIDQGVPPDRILLLTFTRRAAGTMLARADHMIGRKVSSRVWGGTFHAVANRLLRVYGRAMGLPPDFTVVDQSDAADIMNLLRAELGLARKSRRFPRKQTLISIYSRTVSAQDSLSTVLQRYFPWCEEDIDGIRQIFDLYGARKRQANVLDYDDLLLFWKLLTETGGVADRVVDRFDHILVDEYQDTNILQADILRGMRRNNRNICAVGDDAQSIYSFRAATIRNILDFPRHFTGTRIVTLEQNYRSTRPILAASNAVMEQARERYTKNLWSHRASDQKPVLITCLDEAEQTTMVCENVIAHLEQGIPLVRQAVLFRAGHHSDQLEVELIRRNIPFHKYGGLKFIESAHIKDMLAFLRILENPYDEISWYRVLMLLAGVGPRSAQRLIDELGVRRPALGANREPAAEAEPCPGTPLRRLIDNPPKPPPAAKDQWEKLRAAIRHCAGIASQGNAENVGGSNGDPSPSVAAQVERLREFYEPIFELSYDNWRVRVRDLEQLEQVAARYRSRGSFITDLTLDPPTSTSDLAGAPFLEEDYLILSTIHSAKGCEWDVVHIIHAADGMIPSDMATGDEEGVEEERRLLYVAMTRAKDTLYIYFPLRYYHRKSRMGDAHSFAQLTRFLPKSLLHLFERREAGRVAQDAEERIEPLGIKQLEDRLKHLWRE